MTSGADIYQGERRVAHLSRSPEGIRYHRDPSVALDRGMLSTTLPASLSDRTDRDLPAYFLNLLPEGARLRLLLESARDPDDQLDLLLRVGADAIGDVSVVPHGMPLPKAESSRLDPARQSFWEEFRARYAADGDGAIPGVQEKISAATVSFPIRTQAKSAILKLSPERYPRLAENEAFFLRAAKDCGIPTARAHLVHDASGEPGLLVERFDRVRSGRLHVEDVCQLLDLPPGRKYQVSFREVVEVVARWASAPTVETMRLLELYAFSYLIGNGDLHAKNVSLIWSPVVRLSPAYDLLSTLPYPNLERRMALPLDGRDDNFRLDHFVSFGERYRLRPDAVRARITRVCERLEPWIERMAEIGLEVEATEGLQAEVRRRVRTLQR